MNFQAFINDIQSNQWDVHGVEVYEKGVLTHSYGDTKEHCYPIYSATKSVLSVAVGIACDEGKFDVGRGVLEYLPEAVKRNMEKMQLETFQKITIERLLTMSVGGFPFRPEGESWLEFSLACKLDDVENRRFDYSNISAYLVGVALANAIGEDVYSYLERKVFAPLGIGKPVCTRCPDGYFYGASGMELSVNELSRFGLLLYHGGIYEGKKIVSEEYVKRATSVRQENREGGYGYFFWKYWDGFSINGKWGQRCYVLPREERMVTFLSHLENGSGEVKASMERAF